VDRTFALDKPLLQLVPRSLALSNVAFVLVGARLLLYDTTVNMTAYQPVFNERIIAFLFGIAAMYSAYMIRRGKKSAEWLPFAAFLLVAVNFLTLWVLSFEVWDYFGSRLIGAGQATSRVALQKYAEPLAYCPVGVLCHYSSGGWYSQEMASGTPLSSWPAHNTYRQGISL
jgi:hypothetical protein